MPGFNRNYGGASVYVDISDLMDTINMMKIAMSSPAFDEMLRRTFNDAGKKVKSIIRKEVPKEYAVTAAWAGSAVGWPKSQGGAGRIGVVVPIDGTPFQHFLHLQRVGVSVALAHLRVGHCLLIVVNKYSYAKHNREHCEREHSASHEKLLRCVYRCVFIHLFFCCCNACANLSFLLEITMRKVMLCPYP